MIKLILKYKIFTPMQPSGLRILYFWGSLSYIWKHKIINVIINSGLSGEYNEAQFEKLLSHKIKPLIY